MGSVKDLVREGVVGRLYVPPTATDFGQGVWRVSGRFSVGDLKELIPDVEIKDKAEALTMSTAAFFEWLGATHPEIPTCYLGVVDNDSMMTSVAKMLKKGDRTNLIAMRLAHVPESFSDGDLKKYREALSSGELQCGVADVESIFRHGFPLGSSTFERMFKTVYGKKEGGDMYNALATYPETVAALDILRETVARGREDGTANYPELEELLKRSHLDKIPNPGFVLRDIVYDSTSKFEKSGDRVLSQEEEIRFSGLSNEGYELWTQQMFPALARAQLEYCDERRTLNMDGKAEAVAYKRTPVLTDFACTVDENRQMLEVEIDNIVSGAAFATKMSERLKMPKEKWAIPSNKEIQRAIFRQAGVYSAIGEAKARAERTGNIDGWREYVPQVFAERKIDLRAVTEHSVDLMGYAIGEVANRMLGQKVFDAPPIQSWVRDFLPYSSKIEYQEAAA